MRPSPAAAHSPSQSAAHYRHRPCRAVHRLTAAYSSPPPETAMSSPRLITHHHRIKRIDRVAIASTCRAVSTAPSSRKQRLFTPSALDNSCHPKAAASQGTLHPHPATPGNNLLVRRPTRVGSPTSTTFPASDCIEYQNDADTHRPCSSLETSGRQSAPSPPTSQNSRPSQSPAESQCHPSIPDLAHLQLNRRRITSRSSPSENAAQSPVRRR